MAAPLRVIVHISENDVELRAGRNWFVATRRLPLSSHGEFVIDGNLTSVEYVDRLPTIKVPTLVMAGDHDECDPSLARTMHEKIPGSKLVILPNSGHLAFRDQPKLWIESVRDFMNDSETKAISN